MSHVKNTTLVRVGLLENKCLRKSDFNNVRIINMSPPPLYVHVLCSCCCSANVWHVCVVDLMLTVMEASSFTPSVYSVHALTLLAKVKLQRLGLNDSASVFISFTPQVGFRLQAVLDLWLSASASWSNSTLLRAAPQPISYQIRNCPSLPSVGMCACCI